MSMPRTTEAVSEVEVFAWNECTGHGDTVDSFAEDLNSGADGLHPTSVRMFHAGWIARGELEGTVLV